MPEHLLITPFFHGGALRGCVGTIGHVAEIGGMAPGSFSANATEIYQEGLRLPPGEALPARRARPGRMADHARQPPHARDHSWGDFNAMVGSLRVGRRRLEALYDEHGADANRRPPCPPSSTTRSSGSRRDIAGAPDGTYSGEDCQEDDGFDKRSYWSCASTSRSAATRWSSTGAAPIHRLAAPSTLRTW